MAPSHDDAFREIQLSGKQLVFLFMAFVVIAVVIFLSGVQVGRGVRAERGAIGEGTEAAGGVDAVPLDTLPASASARPGSAAEPVTAGEQLTYAERLGGAAPQPEAMTTASKPQSAPAADDATPSPRAEAPPAVAGPVAETARSAPAAAPTNAVAAPGEPAGTGFAIQIAALRESDEADRIAKRLVGKGYPAYVMAPAKDAPQLYRVRVGKYKDRREADTVAARLQKEEQLKPWVVR